MRLALLGPSAIAIAVALFACSTFSGSSEETPPPSDDGGPDTSDPGTCTPVVVDPANPQSCTADFASDPTNCGTCGHACVDARCELGRCVAEELAPNQLPVAAIDGTTIYSVIGGDIQRADLRTKPLTFQQLTPIVSVVGAIKRLEAYGGQLFVSTDQVQTIVTPAEGKQRGNEVVDKSDPATTDGLFFPGATSYYLGSGSAGGFRLARIDESGSVDYKDKDGFLPVARSGNELFWTETLTNGARIWGRWSEVNEPIVRLGHPIEAFGADGDDVFYAHGPSLSRGSKGQSVEMAKETGEGIGFVVRGNDLFYAVRRTTPVAVRYAVLRVDKCKGGRPVELLDTASVIYGIFAVDDEHLVVTTANGVLRTRR